MILKTNKEEFLDMYEWLIDNPYKSETEYIEENGYEDCEILNDCFACNEAFRLHKEKDKYCKRCPIQWGDDLLCLELGSPYRKLEDLRIQYEESDKLKEDDVFFEAESRLLIEEIIDIAINTWKE